MKRESARTAVLMCVAAALGAFIGKPPAVRPVEPAPAALATMQDGRTAPRSPENASDTAWHYQPGIDPVLQFARIGSEGGVTSAETLHRLSRFLGSLDRDGVRTLLAADDPDDMLDNVDEWIDGNFLDEEWIEWLIYARWAQLEDIGTALAFAEGLDNFAETEAILTTWGLRNPGQAMQVADQFTGWRRESLLSAVALGTARHSPLQALRLLENAEVALDDLDGYFGFVEWTDPEMLVPGTAGEVDEMLAHIDSIHGDERDWVLENLEGELYAALARHDPRQAFDRLTRFDEDTRRQRVGSMIGAASHREIADFLRRGAPGGTLTEPQKAIALSLLSFGADPFGPGMIAPEALAAYAGWIDSLEDPQQRSACAETLAEQMHLDPETAEVLNALTGGKSSVPLSEVGFRDPEQAWQQLRELATAGNAETDDLGLGPEWMLTGGAEDALQRVLTLPQGKVREEALREIALGLTESDPAILEALMASVPADDGDSRATLVLGLATSDPLRAIEHLTSGTLTASDDTARAFAIAARNWVGQDAESAMPWLIEHQQALPEQVIPNSGIVAALADRDIDAALELVASMAHQASYPQLTSQLFATWSASHPAEASAYIDANLAPGPVRDQAVKALVTHLQHYDSAAATRWATTIQDEKLRQGVLGRQ